MRVSDVKTMPLPEAFDRLDLPDPERNLFSSREWMTVIYQTYRPRLFVKYIERNGKIASYIFYSVVKNFLEWKICVCSYCDYCDGHIQQAGDWDLFFDALRGEYPLYRIAVRNFQDGHVRENNHFHILSKEKTHVLDVRGTEEDVWKRTHKSFRSAVKQAGKIGVKVESCSKERLEDFFRCHLKVRREKYRIFPQPYRFFDNIWETYMPAGKGFLLGAFDPEGKFIGANMYLVCGDTLYYKFNTTSRDALRYRPSNLMFWEGIRLARRLGLSFIDLGSSGCHQAGLILFKNHTGAQAYDITHLGFHPEGYKFSGKKILRAWTRFCTLPFMPDAMVRFGSNLVYPYLA